jgi:hypothetical protein
MIVSLLFWPERILRAAEIISLLFLPNIDKVMAIFIPNGAICRKIKSFNEVATVFTEKLSNLLNILIITLIPDDPLFPVSVDGPDPGSARGRGDPEADLAPRHSRPRRDRAAWPQVPKQTGQKFRLDLNE